MRMRRLRMLIAWSGGLLLCLSFFGCNTELRRARESVEKEDYLQAALLYEKVVEKDPDNDAALRELSKLYCVTLKNTFKCFGKSKELHKRYTKDPTVTSWYKAALYSNAQDAYLSNQLKTAEKYLEDYSKLDPDNGRPYFMRANIKYRLNRKPPRNDFELKDAHKLYKKALKHSKKSDMVALSSKKQKALLQWECHMQSGSIYEMWLMDKKKDFIKKMMEEAKKKAKKAAEEAKKNKKKRRRRRRRRRKKKKQEEEPKPKFKANPKHFDAAIEHFKAAGEFSQTHPNKFKRPLPFFKIGMFYANFKDDFETGAKWLKKAEKWGPNDVNVVGNLKMMYDKMAEMAEADKDKKKQKEMEKAAQEYAAKFDSLKGRQ